MDDTHEESGGLLWFLSGVLLGLAAASLFAPKSGNETRQLIIEKTTAGKDAVSHTSRDLADRGREIYERGRQVADDAADLFERGRKLMRGDEPLPPASV
jgi:gas vesicle protein